MLRQTLLVLYLLFFPIVCNGQTKIIDVRGKNSNNQYQDVAYDGERIWALTTDGELVLFNAINGISTLAKVKNDSPIIAIADDKEGNIIIGDKSNAIKKYDKQSQTWRTLFRFENTLLAIASDSKNNYYPITDKGIFDHSTKKYFYPDNSLNLQKKKGTDWFESPQLLTDKNDNIWIGFEYGEWGGELFIFNTIDRKFIVPSLNDFEIMRSPIKSIFQSQESVFVTSGLMHFSTHSSVVKFDNFQASLVFSSEARQAGVTNSTKNEMFRAEYIGPGVYNDQDNCIYFYSQNGIFKGNPKNDLSKIEYWTKVLQPKLHWSKGQTNAVGTPMNVLKLRFIDSERLIFVSQNDGIGIYDGKTLTMIPQRF